MADGIGALGWLVVVCAGALGFGLVKFLIVAMQDKGTGLPLDEPPRGDDAGQTGDAGDPDPPDNRPPR